MRHIYARWIVLIVIVALVIAVDQITKNWVLANLALGESVQPISELYPLFQFTYSRNMGAAFGFLPQAGDLFLVLALIIMVVLLWFYPRVPPEQRVMRWAIAFIMGGAIGNVLDRLQHGAVIDFIHYQIPGVISNVSNLADHAIVGGVIILFITSWRTDAMQKQADRGADTQETRSHDQGETG